MLKPALDKLNAAVKGRKDHIVTLARRASGLTPKRDTAKPDPAEAKADEAGMPTTTAKLVGPDGTEIEVPTWVAALIAEALEQRQAAGQSTPADPAVEGGAPAPAAPVPGDEAPAPKPEDEKEKPMTPDQINALVRSRSRLARLADKAGVATARIDTATDVELARDYIAKAAPHLKAKADAATGPALDALVDAAELAPPVVVNPFERAEKVDAASASPEIEAHALYLQAQGF